MIQFRGYPVPDNPQFVITGTLRNGRRFHPIHTETPWHYNVWQGTVWVIDAAGKRRRVRTIIN